MSPASGFRLAGDGEQLFAIQGRAAFHILDDMLNHPIMTAGEASHFSYRVDKKPGPNGTGAEFIWAVNVQARGRA